MRRAILILQLLLVAVVLILWGLSYTYNGTVGWRGYGVLFDRGGIYPLTPALLMNDPFARVRRADETLTLEDGTIGEAPQRWKPVRAFDTGLWGYQWVISLWLPAVLLAVSAVKLWHPRRRRRDEPRGFEVHGAEGRTA
jgi:hypothetical protein